MNFPLVFAALFAWFIWKVRNGVNGMSGSLGAMPDTDCTVWTPPVWKRGVGQRWVPATTQKIGVVCGYHLVRVDHQTGERIYSSSGGAGGTQTGQDPDYGDEPADCDNLEWWQWYEKAKCSEWLQQQIEDFGEEFEAGLDDY